MTTVQQRTEALRLAEELGNVAEACRRTGIDRTSFYRWRKRRSAEGDVGLENRSRAHHAHPATLSPKVELRVLRQSLIRPEWGCRRVAAQLRKEGYPVSPATVQRVLRKQRLEHWSLRCTLAAAAWGEGMGRGVFDDETLRVLRKRCPVLVDREQPEVRPGAVWYVDAILLPRRLRNPLRYGIILVTDAASGLAFARLVFGQLNARDVWQLFQGEVLPRLDQNRCIERIEFGSAFGGMILEFRELLKESYKQRSRPLSLGLKSEDFSPWGRMLIKLMNQERFYLRPGRPSGFQCSQSVRDWFKRYRSEMRIHAYPNFGQTPEERWAQPRPQPEGLKSVPAQPLFRALLGAGQGAGQGALRESANFPRQAQDAWKPASFKPNAPRVRVPRPDPQVVPHPPPALPIAAPLLDPARAFLEDLAAMRREAHALRCRTCKHASNTPTGAARCSLLRAIIQLDDPACEHHLVVPWSMGAYGIEEW